MNDIIHSKITLEPGRCAPTGARICPCRDIPCILHRCGCYGLYFSAFAALECPCSLGARPPLAQGSRRPLSAWNGGCGHHLGHRHARRRCSLGAGRGATLQGLVCSGRRTVGRAARAELHRHQTPRPTRRGQRFALLAHQACKRPKPQRSTRALAYSLVAFWRASARRTVPWFATLEGGAVPLAYWVPWLMGGQL